MTKEGFESYRASVTLVEGDEAPATDVRLDSLADMEFDADGNMWMVENDFGAGQNYVRLINPEGITPLVNLSSPGCAFAEGEPFKQACIHANAIDIGPDGKVYFSGGHRLYVAEPPLPGFNPGDYVVASEGG